MANGFNVMLDNPLSTAVNLEMDPATLLRLLDCEAAPLEIATWSHNESSATIKLNEADSCRT